MDRKQAKQYIKKNWNISSGKRIAKMVKRYGEKYLYEQFEQAQEIFGKTGESVKKAGSDSKRVRKKV